MSRVIRLSNLTWAALATVVGVSAESLTDKHARTVIDRLVWRDAQPPAVVTQATTADQILRAYRVAPDSASWLAEQKKTSLKRLARKLGMITTDTINGRYYRKDELIALIVAAPLSALKRDDQ